ncbi:hypothetical protein STPL106120_04245 [Streptococcus pluranimalium]
MKSFYKILFLIIVWLILKVLISHFTGLEFRWWISVGIIVGSLIGYYVIDKKHKGL